jgi:hypothetical protein
VGKTWLLDTETKGTGAHVVPLDSVLKEPTAEQDLAIVALERPPRATKSAEPRAPLAFKVIDIMSGRLLAEGIGTRAAVELLEGMRSVLDVRLYVWMQYEERWRLLTLDEQKALWGFRRQAAVAAAHQGIRRGSLHASQRRSRRQPGGSYGRIQTGERAHQQGDANASRDRQHGHDKDPSLD